MNTDFLTPVHDALDASLNLSKPGSIGDSIGVYTRKNGFPDLTNLDIAIIGVDEDRNTDENFGSGKDIYHIRNHFYKLFLGSWNVSVADLGNIKKRSSSFRHPFCNHRGY